MAVTLFEKIFHIQIVIINFFYVFQDVHNSGSTVQLNMQIHRSILPITAHVRNQMACIQLIINGNMHRVQVPLDQLLPGKQFSINIPGFGRDIRISKIPKKPVDDDVYNYSMCLLQYAFVILSLKDAIKEGDIDRVNVCLKLMIPLFFQHSELSKYMAECIDYIQKTEVLLSPRMAIKVRAASFVNKSGQLGRNKPADIEKENQVKILKDMIRGLGSNKTEEAIVKISKAAPVIEAVTEKFDEQAGVTKVRTSHKMRSLDDDLSVVGKKLREIRPFHSQNGRRIPSFVNIASSPTEHMNIRRYCEVVERTAFRLQRGQVHDEFYDDDDDSDVDREDDPNDAFDM